jgi:hypothetical protein
MSTHAVLYTKLNMVRGTTNIWSHCWIGGLTGSLMVVVGDADGDYLTGALPGESWGVNGEAEAKAGGTSNERTVHWTATVDDPSLLSEAKTVDIEHTWAPRNRLGENPLSSGWVLAFSPQAPAIFLRALEMHGVSAHPRPERDP